MLKFKIKLLREDAILPSQSHTGDAGWDVATPDDITIQPGETKIVPLGFAAEFETGYECQVRSRSGNAAKLSVSVLNGPGTIDSSYRGEYGAILHNHSKGEVFFAKGTKIAQLVFQKYETIEPEIVQELSNTSRGAGGYGSTDQK